MGQTYPGQIESSSYHIVYKEIDRIREDTKNRSKVSYRYIVCSKARK